MICISCQDFSPPSIKPYNLPGNQIVGKGSCQSRSEGQYLFQAAFVWGFSHFISSCKKKVHYDLNKTISAFLEVQFSSFSYQ
jgi:hypothetical protein